MPIASALRPSAPGTTRDARQCRAWLDASLVAQIGEGIGLAGLDHLERLLVGRRAAPARRVALVSVLRTISSLALSARRPRSGGRAGRHRRASGSASRRARAATISISMKAGAKSIRPMRSGVGARKMTSAAPSRSAFDAGVRASRTPSADTARPARAPSRRRDRARRRVSAPLASFFARNGMVTMAARSAPVGASCAFCSGVADCASAAVPNSSTTRHARIARMNAPSIIDEAYGCGPS